ncbi:hypothetical protein BOX15_Mlig032051g2, partial [Macrostomum lignano]
HDCCGCCPAKLCNSRTTAALSGTVLTILAGSTAHGISRAAASHSTPMRAMWLLLFLVFLGLFFNNASTLVRRLSENKISKSYELDKVPFVFPDLYFCPINPYSGSFPFVLSTEEARQVNQEIRRLGKLYDDVFGNSSGEMHMSLKSRASFIQNSLPVDLITKYLTHRKSQSILRCNISSLHETFSVAVEEFSHPENLICFKLVLTEEQRHQMETKMYKLEVQLSADPYFKDFSYSGHHIKPMVDPDSGEEILYQDWHPTVGIEKLKSSGFTMLIVQNGTYPSFDHETSFLLAPGKSYTVSLEMEENFFSHDLHGTNCSVNNPNVTFKDYLTDEKVNFTYSYAACYYHEMTKQLLKELDCVFSHYPIIWSMRHAKRCFNMSESSKRSIQALKNKPIDWKQIEADVKRICRLSQPCQHPEYSASFSFATWPSVGSSAVSYFARMPLLNDSEHLAPAIAELIKIAKQLDSGEHPAHLEGVFRSYIAESMVSVTIAPSSTVSPQVVISRSYSFTAFLADTGGLLGLYIGCSLLTVCEIFELFYSLVEKLRSSGGKKTPANCQTELEMQADGAAESLVRPPPSA